MLSVDCLEDKQCEPQITDCPLGLQELSAPPDNQSEAPLRALPPEPDTKDPLDRFMKTRASPPSHENTKHHGFSPTALTLRTCLTCA